MLNAVSVSILVGVTMVSVTQLFLLKVMAVLLVILDMGIHDKTFQPPMIFVSCERYMTYTSSLCKGGYK